VVRSSAQTETAIKVAIEAFDHGSAVLADRAAGLGPRAAGEPPGGSNSR